MVKLTILAGTITLFSAYSFIRLILLSRQIECWIEVKGYLKKYERYSANPESVSNYWNENPQGRDVNQRILYRHQNTEYLSRKLSALDYIIPFWGNFNSHVNKKIIMSKFGKDLKIFINPDNPKQSLIDKSIKREWFIYLSLIFSFSLSILILLVYYGNYSN